MMTLGQSTGFDCIFVHVEKRHFKSELEKNSIFGTTDFVISMEGNFSNVRQLLLQVYRD